MHVQKFEYLMNCLSKFKKQTHSGKLLLRAFKWAINADFWGKSKFWCEHPNNCHKFPLRWFYNHYFLLYKTYSLRKIWKKPNDIACFFTFFKSNIIGPNLGQILPHQDHTQFDFICWFIRSNEICWRNPNNFKNLIGIQ